MEKNPVRFDKVGGIPLSETWNLTQISLIARRMFGRLDSWTAQMGRSQLINCMDGISRRLRRCARRMFGRPYSWILQTEKSKQLINNPRDLRNLRAKYIHRYNQIKTAHQ